MNQTTFVNALTKLMREHGELQANTAKRIGVGQSQVCNWLKGRSEPTYYSLSILAKAYQVCPSYFFKEHA